MEPVTLYDTAVFDVNLYNVVDAMGTLTVNGGAVPVTIDTPGQNAVLTFTVSATELVTVRLTSNTIGYTSVQLKSGNTIVSPLSPPRRLSLCRKNRLGPARIRLPWIQISTTPAISLLP